MKKRYPIRLCGLHLLPLPSIFFVRISRTQFTPDMKKIFILSVIISFAMICSCQKQDSAAEQELAQRKTELDAREKALDERMNALDEKVKALDERVKTLAENKRPWQTPDNSSGGQGETRDPAQIKAEREENTTVSRRDAGQDGRPLAAERCES